MKGVLYIIRPHEVEKFIRELNAPPECDELQMLVEGYLEVVPFFTVSFLGLPCVAFCNEEGKLENKDVNTFATSIWHDQSPESKRDYLVGNIVIVTGDDELMSAL